MPIPDQSVVEPILKKHSKTITSFIFKSWSDFLATGYAASWTKRGRANFVWEQMATYAKATFGQDSSIRIITGHETLKFLVDDKVLFRLKKGNESGLSANYPTQGALAYSDPESDLFGNPEVPRVDVVYKLNRLETAIQDILVVGRAGDDIAWTFSVMDRGADIVVLPAAPQPQPPSRKLVRPRQDNDNARTVDQRE